MAQQQMHLYIRACRPYMPACMCMHRHGSHMRANDCAQPQNTPPLCILRCAKSRNVNGLVRAAVERPRPCSHVHEAVEGPRWPNYLAQPLSSFVCPASEACMYLYETGRPTLMICLQRDLRRAGRRSGRGRAKDAVCLEGSLAAATSGGWLTAGVHRRPTRW